MGQLIGPSHGPNKWSGGPLANGVLGPYGAPFGTLAGRIMRCMGGLQTCLGGIYPILFYPFYSGPIIGPISKKVVKVLQRVKTGGLGVHCRPDKSCGKIFGFGPIIGPPISLRLGPPKHKHWL